MRKQSLLESADEQKYVDWAKTREIICEKVKFAVAGYPDRLSVLPNALHVWIEFKHRGKLPEPIQSYRMRTLRDAGALVGWTDDSAVAIFAVRTLMDPTRVSKAGYPTSAKSVSGRLILRSWFGEDLCLSRVVEDFEKSGLSFANPSGRPTKTDV